MSSQLELRRPSSRNARAVLHPIACAAFVESQSLTKIAIASPRMRLQMRWPQSLWHVLAVICILAAPLKSAEAQVCSLPSPGQGGSASPPSSCGRMSFCIGIRHVICSCGGDASCQFSCCGSEQSCQLQAIGEDAPAGNYQCCYSGALCGNAEPGDGVTMSSATCSGSESFPCEVKGGSQPSPCSNGPGLCSQGGTCVFKSGHPEISFPSGGRVLLAADGHAMCGGAHTRRP